GKNSFAETGLLQGFLTPGFQLHETAVKLNPPGFFARMGARKYEAPAAFTDLKETKLSEAEIKFVEELSTCTPLHPELDKIIHSASDAVGFLSLTLDFLDKRPSLTDRDFEALLTHTPRGTLWGFHGAFDPIDAEAAKRGLGHWKRGEQGTVDV